MALRVAATLLRFRCQPRSYVLSLSARSHATAAEKIAVPQDLKFPESHEWVKVDGEIGTVGITDHAQHELGDVVFAELPEVGTEVNKGKQFGVVESVKACSDLNSPVSGQVVEVNQAVKDTPALVNKSAFTDGWLIRVKLGNMSQVEELMDTPHYLKHVERESSH